MHRDNRWDVSKAEAHYTNTVVRTLAILLAPLLRKIQEVLPLGVRKHEYFPAGVSALPQFGFQLEKLLREILVLRTSGGVEKHNDDAKRNTSPATGGMPQQKTEYRLEELREYARERRSYTKHNSAYWHEGGIEAHRGLKLGKHTYIK
eukprot:Em0015g795a